MRDGHEVQKFPILFHFSEPVDSVETQIGLNSDCVTSLQSSILHFGHSLSSTKNISTLQLIRNKFRKAQSVDLIFDVLVSNTNIDETLHGRNDLNIEISHFSASWNELHGENIVEPTVVFVGSFDHAIRKTIKMMIVAVRRKSF